MQLVATLRSEEGSGIYCDGGAQLAGKMMQLGLIDEMILTVFPTRLERGVVLFPEGRIPPEFQEVGVRTYFSDLIQYRYIRKWG